MRLTPTVPRLLLAAALFASLGACTVVPAYPGAGYQSYSPAAVYVDTYPTYGQPYGYYDEGRRNDYYRRDHRDERRHYEEPRARLISPLEAHFERHRQIRETLGLPRLPGMP